MEKELLRCQEAKRITLTGFIVNLFLTAFKLFAGIIGKSGAMVADGVHSLSDFLTDIIVLIGFKLTAQPEDETHNYGHDKYETLATALISLFLAIVGFEILRTGFEKVVMVLRGESLDRPGVIALIAAAFSIVAKELLYHYTLRSGKKIKSSAITANAWHHRSDALSSIGTLIGIGGAIVLGHQWTILDPIASIAVSFFIFKVAFDILKPAVNELMESSLNESETQEIENILNGNHQVMGYHRLRTRRLGTKAVIECHIFVDEKMDLKSAHDIASEIEEHLKDKFGDTSIITIHVEPYDLKRAIKN